MSRRLQHPFALPPPCARHSRRSGFRVLHKDAGVRAATLRRRPPARRMRGQSTVEFLVLALVLLPLFLIVPLLGKQLDIAQTAASASRYVAFEGTVRHGSSLQPWTADAQLADEVRRRFFSTSSAAVKERRRGGRLRRASQSPVDRSPRRRAVALLRRQRRRRQPASN